MHKAELVCFRTCDVTKRHDFSINIEVNGEKRDSFSKNA